MGLFGKVVPKTAGTSLSVKTNFTYLLVFIYLFSGNQIHAFCYVMLFLQKTFELFALVHKFLLFHFQFIASVDEDLLIYQDMSAYVSLSM